MTNRLEKNPICPTERVHKQEGADGCFFAGLTDLPDDFYRTMIDRLVRVVKKLAVPRYECEDVAQEAWLEAVQNPELFHGEYAVRQLCSWLLRRVVHGKAVDALRRLNQRSCQSLDALAAEPMDRNAAKREDAAEWHEWLTAMVARLQHENSDNCELVCKHYLEGRSIRELADETGWTTNEIGCRLYRGMEQMRQWASTFRLQGETPQ